MRLHLDRTASPLGEILLVSDDAGALRGLDFADHAARLQQLLRRQNGDYALNEAPAPAAMRRALADYFDGDLGAIDGLAIATGGTAFQRRVWQALRTIPAGATTSYGELAAVLSHPRASRAVGLANGSNPISIVVPCHRVIGADGSLTGYGGGLPRKRWLLDHERQHCSA